MVAKHKQIFVCDLGFSSVKWAYQGKVGRMISAFQRQANGMIYGSEALVTAGSSYLKTPNDLITFYPAFVKEAAKVAGVKGDDILLVLGLPYQFWEQETEAKKSRDPSAIDSLEKSCVSGPFASVMVLPQGLGGIQCFLKRGAACDASVKNILGIDIGFNTVIYTLYDVAHNKILYSNTSYKSGVYQMAVKLLMPGIAKLAPGKTFTPVEVAVILEKGFVQYGMDEYDISPQISAAAVTYIKDTIRDVTGEIQAHLGVAAAFDQVLFFGGGAHFIKEVVPSKRIKVNTIYEPEFANTRGFALIASRFAEEGDGVWVA